MDVGDPGAVHRDHAEARLVRALHGDPGELVAGEVAAGLRAEHERVAAAGGEVGVLDRDVAVRQLGAERVVALEGQRVVVGIGVKVGDLDVPGADHVPAVPVHRGVDREPVGDHVRAAVDQRGEVATLAQRDAAQGQVGAAGQRDDLVGLTGVGVAGDEPAAAVDHAGADEADVAEAVAPDHRVVEVAVAVVLVLVPLVRLWRVVAAGAAADHRAGVELEGDVAPQVDRVARAVGAGREPQDAVAGGARRTDRPVDRGTVVRGAVAGGAVVPDVEDHGRRPRTGHDHRRGGGRPGLGPHRRAHTRRRRRHGRRGDRVLTPERCHREDHQSDEPTRP